MKDITQEERIEELRRLLDDWYAGESDPDIETGISRLFGLIKPLPADLMVDREMFDALQNQSMKEVSMNPEAERKLEAAMSALFCSEGSANRRKFGMSRLAVAISAAASLLIVFTVIFHLMKGEKMSRVPVKHSEVVANASAPLPVDSVAVATPNALAMSGVNSVSGSHVPVSATKKAAATRRVSAPASSTRTDTDSIAAPGYDEDDDFIIAVSEEEELLADANYRVVVDEREANSIINDVFSRIDDSFDRRNIRVHNISSEYDRHVKL